MKKSKDKVIDGVCAGIAEHLDIDPLWIRIGFLLCNMPLIYLVLMAIMDEADETKE